MTVEEHYNALAPKLAAYLMANGNDESAAADIVQETFLRLWKMRGELSEDPSQVSGLVFTIAKRLVIDRARKASHEVLQDEIRDADEPSGETTVTAGSTPVEAPALPSDTAYLRERLRQAFAQLPPLLREAYTLFQLGELPIAEIARRINVSESLVKVRIFRAKEKLRPLLKDLL